MDNGYKYLIEQVDKKFLKENKISKDDIVLLFDVINALEDQVKLYKTIIREGRHITIE